MFLAFVKKTFMKHVKLDLAKCLLATCTFNFQMSKGAHNIFTMVNFLFINQKPKHIIIGLFKAHDTSGAMMVVKLKQIFNKFEFTQKIMGYVKNQGSNLQTFATTPNSIVLCINLNIIEPFDGFYYRHELSRVCQYAISNDKAFHGLHYVSKDHIDNQKCITWLNKSKRGSKLRRRHVWILV